MNRISFSSLAAAGLLVSASALAQTEIMNVDGTFEAGAPNPSNRHAFDVEAGQTIEVIVRGDGVDTALNAQLPNGENYYNDDYDGLDAGFVRTFASAGTVTVEARPLSSGETGSYTLVVRELPPAAEVAIGDAVTGRLTGGSGDRYQITGEAGQRVIIDLKSYDFDAYLTLVDADGNEISDDDGGDEGFNSRLQYHFREAGTVTVTAGSLGGGSEGRYEFSVEGLDSEQVAQHDGTLGAGDERAYDGKLFDVYEIDGEAGETLSVTVESDDFDTVVYVSNPDGTNLGRNDDGNDGTNSELIVRLYESGTHKVFVTALSDDSGDYTLTIFK